MDFSLSREDLRLLRAKEISLMLAVAKGVRLSKEEPNISCRSIIGWDRAQLSTTGSLQLSDEGFGLALDWTDILKKTMKFIA